MGMQRPMEFSPGRWFCIQQVLDLVRNCSASLSKDLASSVELKHYRAGSFPRLRILKPDANEIIVERVARQICETGLDGFPVVRQSEDVREAVFKYITKAILSGPEIQLVEQAGSGSLYSESTKNTLLLLRGLLAGGVLAFSLRQKR